MKIKLLKFAVFACLGITAEIIFTAFYDVFEGIKSTAELWKLEGNSYVWMIFIYGSASFLIPFFYKIIKRFNLPIRLLLYALGIFLIEYLTGFFLELTTGQCPWKYDTGMHISGYIRLDYTPFWMFFGWILESLHLGFDRIVGKGLE